MCSHGVEVDRGIVSGGERLVAPGLRMLQPLLI